MVERAAELQAFIAHLRVERRLAERTLAMYGQALGWLQAFTTRANSRSKLTVKSLLRRILRKLLRSFRSCGCITALGSGDHQSIGCPCSNHGKIPME